MGRSLRFMGVNVAEDSSGRSVRFGLVWNRRRVHEQVPRTRRITARYSDEEMQTVLANAAAARLAPAAFVAEASLRPARSVGQRRRGEGGPVEDDQGPVGQVEGDDEPAGELRVELGGELVDAAELHRMLLLELLGVHRQLRGACTNLNQAVAKLNALNQPVGELPAIAAYVRRVTTAVDEAIVAVQPRR